jgi:hypothetical protein
MTTPLERVVTDQAGGRSVQKPRQNTRNQKFPGLVVLWGEDKKNMTSTALCVDLGGIRGESVRDIVQEMDSHVGSA